MDRMKPTVIQQLCPANDAPVSQQILYGIKALSPVTTKQRQTLGSYGYTNKVFKTSSERSSGKLGTWRR